MANMTISTEPQSEFWMMTKAVVAHRFGMTHGGKGQSGPLGAMAGI